MVDASLYTGMQMKSKGGRLRGVRVRYKLGRRVHSLYHVGPAGLQAAKLPLCPHRAAREELGIDILRPGDHPIHAE